MTHEERVAAVEKTIVREIFPYTYDSVVDMKEVAEAAMAAADATRPVKDAMVTAFREHIETYHNYCEDLEYCCIRGGIRAALKVTE